MHVTIGTLMVQSCNVARVSCNVAGVSYNVARVSCNLARVKNSQKQSNSKNHR